MKIALTGGCGFVGTHIHEALRGAGHVVTVIDRRHPLVPVDLNSSFLFDRLAGAEVIVHAAAHADVAGNWSTGLEAIWEDNVRATWQLLRTAICFESVKAVVLVSTAAVYGDGGPHVETEACRATSPYAASKLAGEALLQAFAEKAGWLWHVARLVGCVGDGYAHGHIADFVEMALTAEGIRARDDGKAAKSMIHVRDAADAIALLAGGSVGSGIYNVTSHGVWSWRDTVREMGITRFESAPEQRGWVGDPLGLRVDGTRLEAWGWSPRRSLALGVRESLDSLAWPWPFERLAK